LIVSHLELCLELFAIEASLPGVHLCLCLKRGCL